MGGLYYAVRQHVPLPHLRGFLLCIGKSFQHLVHLAMVETVSFEIRQTIGYRGQVVRSPIAEEHQVASMWLPRREKNDGSFCERKTRF